MQSSQLRHIENQIFQGISKVTPFSDNGPKHPPVWLSGDPFTLAEDWFSLDERHLVQTIKDYASKLTERRDVSNVEKAKILKEVLKRILINLQVNINYLDQKLLYFEIEEEIIELTSLYLDCELRVYLSTPNHTQNENQKMVDQLLYWLYNMLPNTSNRIDALLSLAMAYKQQSKTILDPVFRKVLSELQSGPLSDVAYVRHLYFYKLWKDKIVDEKDRSADKLREKVLSSLTSINPYTKFSGSLLSCLPNVYEKVLNVTEFFVNADIHLRTKCKQFLACRRSQLENIEPNVDILNDGNPMAINNNLLGFLCDERDEMSELLDMIETLGRTSKEQQSIELVKAHNQQIIDTIDLTEETTSNVIDLIENETDQEDIDDTVVDLTEQEEDYLSYTSRINQPQKLLNRQNVEEDSINGSRITSPMSTSSSSDENCSKSFNLPQGRLIIYFKGKEDKSYARRHTEKQRSKINIKRKSEKVPQTKSKSVAEDLFEITTECDKLSRISIEENDLCRTENLTKNNNSNQNFNRFNKSSVNSAIDRTCNNDSVNKCETSIVPYISDFPNQKQISNLNKTFNHRCKTLEENNSSNRIRFDDNALGHHQKKVNIVTPSKRSPMNGLKTLNQERNKTIEPILDEKLQTETCGSNGLKLQTIYPKPNTSNFQSSSSQPKTINYDSEINNTSNKVLDNRLGPISNLTDKSLLLDDLQRTDTITTNLLLQERNVPGSPYQDKPRALQIRPDFTLPEEVSNLLKKKSCENLQGSIESLNRLKPLHNREIVPFLQKELSSTETEKLHFYLQKDLSLTKTEKSRSPCRKAETIDRFQDNVEVPLGRTTSLQNFETAEKFFMENINKSKLDDASELLNKDERKSLLHLRFIDKKKLLSRSDCSLPELNKLEQNFVERTNSLAEITRLLDKNEGSLPERVNLGHESRTNFEKIHEKETLIPEIVKQTEDTVGSKSTESEELQNLEKDLPDSNSMFENSEIIPSKVKESRDVDYEINSQEIIYENLEPVVKELVNDSVDSRTNFEEVLDQKSSDTKKPEDWSENNLLIMPLDLNKTENADVVSCVDTINAGNLVNDLSTEISKEKFETCSEVEINLERVSTAIDCMETASNKIETELNKSKSKMESSKIIEEPPLITLENKNVIESGDSSEQAAVSSAKNDLQETTAINIVEKCISNVKELEIVPALESTNVEEHKIRSSPSREEIKESVKILETVQIDTQATNDQHSPQFETTSLKTETEALKSIQANNIDINSETQFEKQKELEKFQVDVLELSDKHEIIEEKMIEETSCSSHQEKETVEPKEPIQFGSVCACLTACVCGIEETSCPTHQEKETFDPKEPIQFDSVCASKEKKSVKSESKGKTKLEQLNLEVVENVSQSEEQTVQSNMLQDGSIGEFDETQLSERIEEGEVLPKAIEPTESGATETSERTTIKCKNKLKTNVEKSSSVEINKPKLREQPKRAAKSHNKSQTKPVEVDDKSETSKSSISIPETNINISQEASPVQVDQDQKNPEDDNKKDISDTKTDLPLNVSFDACQESIKIQIEAIEDDNKMLQVDNKIENITENLVSSQVSKSECDKKIQSEDITKSSGGVLSHNNECINKVQPETVLEALPVVTDVPCNKPVTEVTFTQKKFIEMEESVSSEGSEKQSEDQEFNLKNLCRDIQPIVVIEKMNNVGQFLNEKDGVLEVLQNDLTNETVECQNLEVQKLAPVIQESEKETCPTENVTSEEMKSDPQSIEDVLLEIESVIAEKPDKSEDLNLTTTQNLLPVKESGDQPIAESTFDKIEINQTDKIVKNVRKIKKPTNKSKTKTTKLETYKNEIQKNFDPFGTESSPNKEEIESVIVTEGTINFLVKTEGDSQDVRKKPRKKTTLNNLYQIVVPKKKTKPEAFKAKKRSIPNLKAKRILRNGNLYKTENTKVLRSSRKGLKDQKKEVLKNADICCNEEIKHNEEFKNLDTEKQESNFVKTLSDPKISTTPIETEEIINLPKEKEKEFKNLETEIKEPKSILIGSLLDLKTTSIEKEETKNKEIANLDSKIDNIETIKPLQTSVIDSEVSQSEVTKNLLEAKVTNLDSKVPPLDKVDSNILSETKPTTVETKITETVKPKADSKISTTTVEKSDDTLKQKSISKTPILDKKLCKVKVKTSQNDFKNIESLIAKVNIKAFSKILNEKMADGKIYDKVLEEKSKTTNSVTPVEKGNSSKTKAEVLLETENQPKENRPLKEAMTREKSKEEVAKIEEIKIVTDEPKEVAVEEKVSIESQNLVQTKGASTEEVVASVSQAVVEKTVKVDLVPVYGQSETLVFSEEKVEDLIIETPKEIVPATDVKMSLIPFLNQLSFEEPPMLHETCIIKQFHEIGYAHERVVKCSVNGQAKSNQIVFMALNKIEENKCEEIKEFTVEESTVGNAIECVDNLTSSMVDVKVLLAPAPQSINHYNFSKLLEPEFPVQNEIDADYGMLMLAFASSLDPLPITKSDKTTDIQKGYIEDNTTVTNIIQTEPDPTEFTIPNTADLQLNPDDFDHGYSPSIPIIQPPTDIYNLENGGNKDFFANFVCETPRREELVVEAPQNLLVSEQLPAQLENVETTPKVVPSPKKNTTPTGSSKTKISEDKVKYMINKFKENKSSEKTKKPVVETKDTTPSSYIRSTRPSRMTTRKKTIATLATLNQPEETPVKPTEKSQLDDVFDRLYMEYKMQKAEKDKQIVNKSFNTSIDSNISDDMPLIQYIKKKEPEALPVSAQTKVDNKVETKTDDKCDSSEESIKKMLRESTETLQQDNRTKTPPRQSKRQVKELQRTCEKLKQKLNIDLPKTDDLLDNLSDEDLPLNERIEKKTLLDKDLPVIERINKKKEKATVLDADPEEDLPLQKRLEMSNKNRKTVVDLLTSDSLEKIDEPKLEKGRSSSKGCKVDVEKPLETILEAQTEKRATSKIRKSLDSDIKIDESKPEISDKRSSSKGRKNLDLLFDDLEKKKSKNLEIDKKVEPVLEIGKKSRGRKGSENLDVKVKADDKIETTTEKRSNFKNRRNSETVIEAKTDETTKKSEPKTERVSRSKSRNEIKAEELFDLIKNETISSDLAKNKTKSKEIAPSEVKSDTSKEISSKKEKEKPPVVATKADKTKTDSKTQKEVQKLTPPTTSEKMKEENLKSDKKKSVDKIDQKKPSIETREEKPTIATKVEKPIPEASKDKMSEKSAKETKAKVLPTEKDEPKEVEASKEKQKELPKKLDKSNKKFETEILKKDEKKIDESKPSSEKEKLKKSNKRKYSEVSSDAETKSTDEVVKTKSAKLDLSTKEAKSLEKELKTSKSETDFSKTEIDTSKTEVDASKKEVDASKKENKKSKIVEVQVSKISKLPNTKISTKDSKLPKEPEIDVLLKDLTQKDSKRTKVSETPLKDKVECSAKEKVAETSTKDKKLESPSTKGKIVESSTKGKIIEVSVKEKIAETFTKGNTAESSTKGKTGEASSKDKLSEGSSKTKVMEKVIPKDTAKSDSKKTKVAETPVKETKTSKVTEKDSLIKDEKAKQSKSEKGTSVKESMNKILESVVTLKDGKTKSTETVPLTEKQETLAKDQEKINTKEKEKSVIDNRISVKGKEKSVKQKKTKVKENKPKFSEIKTPKEEDQAAKLSEPDIDIMANKLKKEAKIDKSVLESKKTKVEIQTSELPETTNLTAVVDKPTVAETEIIPEAKSKITETSNIVEKWLDSNPEPELYKTPSHEPTTFSNTDDCAFEEVSNSSEFYLSAQDKNVNNEKIAEKLPLYATPDSGIVTEEDFSSKYSPCNFSPPTDVATTPISSQPEPLPIVEENLASAKESVKLDVFSTVKTDSVKLTVSIDLEKITEILPVLKKRKLDVSNEVTELKNDSIAEIPTVLTPDTEEPIPAPTTITEENSTKCPENLEIPQIDTPSSNVEEPHIGTPSSNTEEVPLPSSTEQLEIGSTPYQNIPSNSTQQDYSESILGITESPCYIASPYTSENSRLDAESSNLGTVCEEGIDLIYYSDQYYESIESFVSTDHVQQAAESFTRSIDHVNLSADGKDPSTMQAGYGGVPDSQFNAYDEVRMSDEDLFCIDRNMVTVRMHEIQPEKTKAEKLGLLNNSGSNLNNIDIVFGNEITNDEIQVFMLENNAEMSINSHTLLHEEIPIENEMEIEPSNLNVSEPKLGNEKVIVEKINDSILPVLNISDDILSLEIANEHQYETKLDKKEPSILKTPEKLQNKPFYKKETPIIKNDFINDIYELTTEIEISNKSKPFAEDKVTKEKSLTTDDFYTKASTPFSPDIVYKSTKDDRTNLKSPLASENTELLTLKAVPKRKELELPQEPTLHKMTDLDTSLNISKSSQLTLTSEKNELLTSKAVSESKEVKSSPGSTFLPKIVEMEASQVPQKSKEILPPQKTRIQMNVPSSDNKTKLKSHVDYKYQTDRQKYDDYKRRQSTEEKKKSLADHSVTDTDRSRSLTMKGEPQKRDGFPPSKFYKTSTPIQKDPNGYTSRSQTRELERKNLERDLERRELKDRRDLDRRELERRELEMSRKRSASNELTRPIVKQPRRDDYKVSSHTRSSFMNSSSNSCKSDRYKSDYKLFPVESGKKKSSSARSPYSSPSSSNAIRSSIEAKPAGSMSSTHRTQERSSRTRRPSDPNKTDWLHNSELLSVLERCRPY